MIFQNPLHSDYNYQLFQAYKEILETSEVPIGGKWTFSQMEQCLSGRYVVGALDENRKLIGFLIFSQGSEESFDLLLLGVTKPHRKKGVMSALLDFFIREFSFKQTSVHLFVEVHEKNYPAMSFYQKKGFQLVGYRKNFYGRDQSAYLLDLHIKF